MPNVHVICFDKHAVGFN